jgi:hypothetical protein
MSRWGFNWFPAYRANGARIEYIAADWQEVRSGAVEPPHPQLRWNHLWRQHVRGGRPDLHGHADQAPRTRLRGVGQGRRHPVRRPGRSTLRATFRLDDAELVAIRSAVAQAGKSDRQYVVDLTDEAGRVCASCEKVLTIRERRAAPGG